MRFTLPGLLGLAAIVASQAPAQNQSRPQTQATPARLTVEGINSSHTGAPPQGAVWSPDSHRLTFLAAGEDNGLPVGKEGDIVEVDPATGKMSVLASGKDLEALGSNDVNEKDSDHRSRYRMASYLWSPDAQHLLLDKGGKLWLWDIAAHHGTLIVDTRAGSGDDPKFSPDGKLVSYLRDHNLYVHPVARGASGAQAASGETTLTTTPAGTESGAFLNGEVDWVYLEELETRTNYSWAPDSHAIAYLQMDESKVPQYPIEDFLPTHATVDWQRYPQPGDPNPTVRVGVVSAAGGATTWINLPLSAGNDYIPRLGWVDDKTVFAQVLTRDHKHLDLYLADATTGQAHRIHSATDPKYLEDNYGITFLPHGRFLQAGWQDGHMHLYLYEFAQAHPLTAEAHLTRQLTHGDWEVENFEAPAPASTKPGDVTRVLYTSTEGSPLETHLWSIALDGSGKQELTPAPGVHNTLSSPDGRFFTDQSSSSDTPPAVQLCAAADSAPSSCKPIWHAHAVPAAAGTQTRLVTFKAADGRTTLYGHLTEPNPVGTAHAVPIILNPYGGPTPNGGVRNGWTGVGFNQLLAQHGFAVLTVDNRGSGGRGRDFQQADYRDFGAVQLADQLACLDQILASDQQLDPKRVGWWGWSWGGFFTLYAMTHTDRIQAGVAVAPGSTDLRNYDSVYVERYMGLPSDNTAAYRASNVNELAAKLHGRILVVQGTGDDNVHMGSAIQFVQGLITAGVPYDLQLFPRLTHSLAGKPARNELFNRILFQFETYLKPTRSVAPAPPAGSSGSH